MIYHITVSDSKWWDMLCNAGAANRKLLTAVPSESLAIPQDSQFLFPKERQEQRLSVQSHLLLKVLRCYPS